MGSGVKRTVEQDWDAIERAQTGDPSGLEELLSAYDPHLRKFAGRWRNSQRAGYEDVLQEARTVFMERVLVMDEATLRRCKGLFNIQMRRDIADGLALVSDVTERDSAKSRGPMSVPLSGMFSFEEDWGGGASPSAENVFFSYEDDDADGLRDLVPVFLLCIEAGLTERQTDIVEFWVERPGTSHRECAQMLGLSWESYKQSWGQAMSRLRRVMGVEA